MWYIFFWNDFFYQEKLDFFKAADMQTLFFILILSLDWICKNKKSLSADGSCTSLSSSLNNYYSVHLL